MRIGFDTEVYPNYFLATFLFEDGTVETFERFNDRDSDKLLNLYNRIVNHTLITFNGNYYDLVILSMALCGYDNWTLYDASTKIINEGKMPWDMERVYNFKTVDIDHVDIKNILALFQSLKLYGARNGTRRLQELPFDPHEAVDPGQVVHLRDYCLNDCIVTWELYCAIYPVIELRERVGAEYGVDVRSKSDAQIAETVIKSEFQNLTGQVLRKPIDTGALPTHINYDPPDWVAFRDKELIELATDIATHLFALSPAGKPVAPSWLSKKEVWIGGKPYAFGLGGLHAKNKSESYYSTREQIIDLDVTSYYPSIILNCGYEPEHMGEVFTMIYERLVNRRIEAKAAGNKTDADALKIVINGTFGKLGSRYSAIYSPSLMLSVTFSGQLALLMLIEDMNAAGIPVISANTDGITIMCADDKYQEVVKEWERVTAFNMEETFYKQIHYRDVNNYFAFTTDGKIKTKGVFREAGPLTGSAPFDKNPIHPIVWKAVQAYILFGERIENAIKKTDDIREFLSIRTVRGGAEKDGNYLGKAIRWYYSTATDTAIHYVSNGNKVAKTDGAMPMMDLIEGIPDDLDYEWYIEECYKTLDEVGYYGWL